MGSPSPESQLQPPIPKNPAMHFNEAILTDSPSDYNAVHHTNIALNTLLENNNPLPTPRKEIC